MTEKKALGAVDLVVNRATTETWTLAEGPWWDAPRERLLWVDIIGRSLIQGRLLDGGIGDIHSQTFDRVVSAVAVTTEGAVLLAAQDGLAAVGDDGRLIEGPRVLPRDTGRRLNDGTTDAGGRFLVGSLHMGGRSQNECLAQVDVDGTVRVIDNDLELSNGLAWSAAGDRLFSVDTHARCIYVRDYDAKTGTAGPRAVHLEIDEGFPDGIAVDADDHIWVAIWGAGEVHRYDPAGVLVQRVHVPAPHVSCVAFAGNDLRTLVITTARAELDDEQLRDWPLSGSVFTTRVDTPGLRVTPASASWLN